MTPSLVPHSKLASFYRLLFTGGSMLIVASLLGNFFNFLYNAYLSRVLTLEEIGLVSLFGSFQYISQIVVGAFGATTTQHSAYLLGKHNSLATHFWRYFRKRAWVIALVVTGIWIVTTPLLAHFFQSPSYLPFFLFAPVWLLGIIGAVDSGFLNGSMKFFLLSAMIIIDALAKFTFSVILIQMRMPHLVYASIPLAMVLSCSWGWWWIRRMKSVATPSLLADSSSFPRRFFTVSLFAKVSSIAILSLDVVLVKHFLNPTAAGQYALVSLVGKMVYFIGSLFSQFIFPFVGRSEGAGKSSQMVFFRIMTATAAVSLIGYLIIGMWGFFTVPLLLGARALPIVGFLPDYTLAMALINIATTIVAYHQAKKVYFFPIISIFFAGLQMVLIALFHLDIATVVRMVLFSAMAYAATMVLLHGIYPLRHRIFPVPSKSL